MARRFIVTLGGGIFFGLVIWGCSDLGDPAMDNTGGGKVEPSRDVVSLAPGQQTTVVITGGVPPYYISTPPDSAVATATLTNTSDTSANLVIAAPLSAVIGDNDKVSVGDQVELNEGGGAFDKVGEITHGDHETTVFISISAVGEISFTDEVQPIFTMRCVSSGCHDSGGTSPMSLEAGLSLNNLVNVPVTDQSCGSQLRVKPTNANESMLYLRVSGKSLCARMPQSLIPGLDTLVTSDQNLIRDWINQGAQDN